MERMFESRLGQIMKVYETRVANLEKKHAKHLKTVQERLESSENIQKQLVQLNEKLAVTTEHNLKLSALVLKRLPDQAHLAHAPQDSDSLARVPAEESTAAAHGTSIAAEALALAPST